MSLGKYLLIIASGLIGAAIGITLGIFWLNY